MPRLACWRPLTRTFCVASAAAWLAYADGVGHAYADEVQVWESLTVMGRTGPERGLAAWADVHARRRNNGTLFIVRPAIGYAFSPSLIVHVGYAVLPVVVQDGPNTREQRIWQQVLWNREVNPQLRLQVRGRLEQRIGAGDDLGHRLRILLRAQWQPKASFAGQFVVTNETFVQLNDTDWGPTSGFDQNRAFFGIGADTRIRGVRVEAGYLNVAFRDDNRIDHVAAVNLIANLFPDGK